MKRPSVKNLLDDTSSLSLIIGSAHALLAELAEKTHYDGVWLSSFEAHAWDLLPDANILNTGDYFSLIRKISDRINIPILVDADEGGPSSINTIRMAREYSKAGASAMCFEDNPSPKRCSFYGLKSPLEKSEIMVGKIKAALDHRPSSDFAIIARTEALIQGLGMDTAIERAHQYTEAGCDGFLIHSKSPEPSEVMEFATRYHREGIKTPLVCVPTTYNSVTTEELSDAGFSLAIYANYSVRAAIKAVESVFTAIKQGGSLSCANSDVVEMKRVFDLIRVDKLKASQSKYGS